MSAKITSEHIAELREKWGPRANQIINNPSESAAERLVELIIGIRYAQEDILPLLDALEAAYALSAPGVVKGDAEASAASNKSNIPLSIAPWIVKGSIIGNEKWRLIGWDHGHAEASGPDDPQQDKTGPKASAGSHAYVSTACLHGKHERCRQHCKFCAVDCGCPCHVDLFPMLHVVDPQQDKTGPKS